MFIKDNPEHYFHEGKKGNPTVTFDKEMYIEKMNNILKDEETYQLIKKDSTNKIITDLRDFKGWKSFEYIITSTHNRLSCSNVNPPRAYGLLKIHKQSYPFRIIVSSLDSLLYNLALFLHNIISKSIPKPFSHIDNSVQIVERLSNLHLDNNFVLISLDAISLFTNVTSW